MYELIFTRQADADFRELEEDPSKAAIRHYTPSISPSET
jgi:hypothetical protein